MTSSNTAPPRRALWEQHVCLPLTLDCDVSALTRYARPGGAYVSVNVGYAPHSTDDVLSVIDHYTRRIAAQEGLALAVDVRDVDAAHHDDTVVVAFDLEDSGPLGGDLDLVQRFYDLGVRTLLPTYNHGNAAASGCLDATDAGLTAYGRALVARMNDVGMLVDGSHGSVRTGLGLCEVSAAPVVYSHAGLRAVWDHPRNITDEQALECARTGGVVGIPGIGIFLGPNTGTLDAMIAHIDHAVSLLGPEHVGIGSDYSFDADDVNRELQRNPRLFPESFTRWGPIEFVEPERLLRLETELAARGYPDDSIAGILGGNFRRVAGQVWKTGRPEPESSRTTLSTTSGRSTTP